MHQRVGGAGRQGARAEAAADRLDEGGLASAQVAGESNHGRRAERPPQRFTVPAELVRAEVHGAPDLLGP